MNSGELSVEVKKILPYYPAFRWPNEQDFCLDKSYEEINEDWMKNCFFLTIIKDETAG